MPLRVGTRLGPYEVLAPLGAGGMGEVYRARDTRLDRVVAIKGLPDALGADPERRARFEREARLLAALSHPHIAGIHGIEESTGALYLVLEFVEGETLATRLGRGPLDVGETLEIGRQIAEAVDAAHERGIVHRDLKPGNVMLTPARAVKVLDFGLARGGGSGAAASDLSASPTVALSTTGPGVVLGTAPYMSPEQVRGQPVDRRADVWAFGCILFECLSGRRAFAGEILSDVMARILEREPDWAALPASTPARLRGLIARCLTKNPGARPRDLGDLGRELDALAREMSSPAGSVAAGGRAARPSLAVLYFENLARDPESEYFCAGITEDILTDLSKIKNLRVASRNAVARYRGATVDIAKVASDLGVGAVLEGSVRRAGDRLRITAQLVNPSDGFHLWAERYDRTLQDVFAVQEEIASAIAGALRVALSPDESRQLVQDRPRDVRAYDLYLQGRELYGRYRSDTLREALARFHQAISIDPTYALAWAGIADCHGQRLQWGEAPDEPETVRLGLEAAQRALEINPRLPEALKARSLVLRFSGDREGARLALIQAIEVNPRFLPALTNLAVDRFGEANIAGAERLIRRALEVDPQDAFATLWLTFLSSFTRTGDEVLDLAARIDVLSDEPFYTTLACLFRAAHLLGLEDVSAAERMGRQGVAHGADPDNLRCLEAMIAARRGRTREARQICAELESAPGLGIQGLMIAAAASLRIGEVERAVAFMRRPVVRDLAQTVIRLNRELHPLADLEPFAPRCRDATLVWPLEAPMIDPARFALFREVRIESGSAQGSDVVSEGTSRPIREGAVPAA